MASIASPRQVLPHPQKDHINTSITQLQPLSIPHRSPPPPKRKSHHTRPSMDTHFVTSADSAYLIAASGCIIILFGLVTCFQFAWYTIPMMAAGALVGCAPFSERVLGWLEKNAATGEDETYRGFRGENRKARRERMVREGKARKGSGF